MQTTPLTDAPALCHLGVEALTRHYAKGDLSPVEAMAASLGRAEAVNPTFNAFSLFDHEGALRQAQESEARWRAGRPLSAIDGVPTTLKEFVRVKDWTVNFGSLTTDAAPCIDDAPAVARLRALGAVFIAQTASPEFGWKGVTDSALHGITRNPWNPALTPGGSSGGAAVAAACGAGVLHLGTDAAGSIRIPCAMSGLAGLKPTFGRIAVYPPSPFGTLSHIGPMTRRITDAAHMLRAMAGRDLTDWAQGSGDLGALDAVELTFKGARIGLWATPPCGAVDADVAANLARSAALIEALGADVEPIALPFADTITRDFEAHWFSGAAARLRLVPDEKRGLVDPGFRDIAARGAAIGADELVAAQMARGAFGAAMDQLLDRYDVLIAPGTAIPAFAAGRLVPEGSGLTDWHQWAGFTFPINLSTQPAAVVPNGRTRDGLPTSLQFIGARGADARVLAVARAYEIAMPEYLI